MFYFSFPKNSSPLKRFIKLRMRKKLNFRTTPSPPFKKVMFLPFFFSLSYSIKMHPSLAAAVEIIALVYVAYTTFKLFFALSENHLCCYSISICL